MAFVLSTCAAGTALAALPLEKLRTLNIAGQANELMIAAGLGIDQVSVSGQHYTLDSDIFDALDLPNVRTFVDLDFDAALKRIERISWVDTAQINRVYPSALDIVIRERSPAIVWTRGNKDYLVDGTGRVLGPMPTGGRYVLPRVVGEGAAAEAMDMLSALSRHQSIERQYSYAERVSERRWRLVMKNGTVIELGADRETEGLDEMEGATAGSEALSGAAKVIDLRIPGRIAVRPADIKSAKTASLAEDGHGG